MFKLSADQFPDFLLFGYSGKGILGNQKEGSAIEIQVKKIGCFHKFTEPGPGPDLPSPFGFQCYFLLLKLHQEIIPESL
jgi:hypothetical protein